jgi:hypothetical protein
MKREAPDQQAVLRVDDIIFGAFSAVYVRRGYQYNVALLSDRDGSPYWWAQSAENDPDPYYGNTDALVKRPALYRLKVGAFISAVYKKRIELPGDDQEWHEPFNNEPDGLSIYYVRYTFARRGDRWPCPGDVAAKRRYKALPPMLMKPPGQEWWRKPPPV